MDANYPDGCRQSDIDRQFSCEHGHAPDDCESCDEERAGKCVRCNQWTSYAKRLPASAPYGYRKHFEWYICTDCAYPSE